MKKRILTVICILSVAALLVLNGCTDNNSSGSAKGSSADNSVSQTETSLKDESSKEEKKQDKQRSDADDDPEESESKSSADDAAEQMYSTIDYDLSVMSGTVVYAEVYNIVTDPDTYRGKTIKMTGNLATYHDDKTGMDYFACIIPDATACCSQGIEFRTTDSFRYPEDYPEIGKEITVIGTFDTYKEEPYEYPVLDQAVIV